MRKLTARLSWIMRRIAASPVVIAFITSTSVIWSPVRRRPKGWARVLLGLLAVPLTLLAWAIIVSWCMFRLWLNGDGS
jgi:hypothetical protein